MRKFLNFFSFLTILLFCTNGSAQNSHSFCDSVIKSMTKYLNQGRTDSAARIADIHMNQPDFSGDTKFWYYRGIAYKELFKKHERGVAKSGYREKAAQSYQNALELNGDSALLKDIKKDIKYLAATYHNDAVRFLKEDKESIAQSIYLDDKYLGLMSQIDENFNEKESEIDFLKSLGLIYSKMFDKEGDSHDLEYYDLAKSCYQKVLTLDSTQKSVRYNLVVLETNLKTKSENLLIEESGKKDQTILSLNAVKQLAEARLMESQLQEDAKRKELIVLKNEEMLNKLIGRAGQERKDAVAAAESRKKNIIIYSVGGGLLLVIVFAGFIFRSLRVARKQKNIIEIQKNEVSRQKDIADSQRVIAEELREVAEKQKYIAEEKQKNITDSIRYAKRIQDALLKEEAHISTHLPEHLVLFMPKDIVSGDFYWGSEKHEFWYVAVVDCTGHGVPGAVLSMLGISFLNDIVATEQLLPPAEVLNRLRDKVVRELGQTGNTGGNKDGMDISLVRLNLKTNELQWAGANSSLTLIRNEQLEEVKADKQPIGYYPESRPFTNHQIQLQKGDILYIYSDGYADQYGGPKGKKLMRKNFKAELLKIRHQPMTAQKAYLNQFYDTWKGNTEQVDDVCVIGVRV